MFWHNFLRRCHREWERKGRKSIIWSAQFQLPYTAYSFDLPSVWHWGSRTISHWPFSPWSRPTAASNTRPKHANVQVRLEVLPPFSSGSAGLEPPTTEAAGNNLVILAWGTGEALLTEAARPGLLVQAGVMRVNGSLPSPPHHHRTPHLPLVHPHVGTTLQGWT